MGTTRYFQYPFGGGNLPDTPVPMPTQVDGSISYQAGYSSLYSLNPSAPGALNVARTDWNGVMNDVTTFAQQMQQNGVPNFISTSDNGGSPYPYAKYAQVLYTDGRVYTSLINSNTNLPTDSSAWVWIENFNSYLAIDNPTIDGSVTQNQAVYWNGTAYIGAVSNGAAQMNMVGLADIANNRIITFGIYTYPGGGLISGAIYYLSNTTPGELILNIPSSPNIVRVGVAISTTQMWLNIDIISTFNSGRVPGETAFFAMNSVPQGWLIMNGSVLPVSDYPGLFTAIGNLYGGDGITTFAIPNTYGYFTRAYDPTGTIDPGHVFGTTQADGFTSHTHGLASNTNSDSVDVQALGNTEQGGAAIYARMDDDGGTATGYYFVNTALGAGQQLVSNTGIAETRPKNIAFLNCIKW